MSGPKSKIRLMIKSTCFNSKKKVFNVHITKDNSERFLEGLQEYLRLWEESNENND
jgi:hypothetical protein